MIIPVNINLPEDELKSTRLGVYSYQYLNYKGSEYDLYRIGQALAGRLLFTYLPIVSVFIIENP